MSGKFPCLNGIEFKSEKNIFLVVKEVAILKFKYFFLEKYVSIYIRESKLLLESSTLKDLKIPICDLELDLIFNLREGFGLTTPC